jgi:hypothetical protein
MVLLLVVGVAAVIIVILIAVILSVRLGRGDDHDDYEEPTGRRDERGRGRLDQDDGDVPDRRHQTRALRRPAAGTAPRPARGGQRPRSQAQDGRYPDGGDRRPEREPAGRPADYDRPQRRPGRYDTGPQEQLTDPRRPVTSGAPRSGSGRDRGGRRASVGHDAPEATTRLYDTGPVPGTAADDFPSEPLHAADFPSAEFPSGSQPAADFPSGEFPSAARPAGDAPTARYGPAPRHPDDFPSEPLQAADFASGEFPAADFPSGQFPAADFPSEEMPAARPRSRTASPKAVPGRDRSDSRRRPGKGPDAPKGRSRQQRKRDDDDWPSMESDSLTDEQYWAELSSDKPLSTTARAPRSAAEPAPATAPTSPPGRNGQSRPAATRPKPPVPEGQATPARRAPVAPREAATQPREVATRPREAVPARREAATQPRQAMPAREAATQPRPAVPPREAATQPRVVTGPREALAPREATAPREMAAQQREAVTERLPMRPRQQPAVAQARNGTVGTPGPAAHTAPVAPMAPTGPVRPDAAATSPGREPSLAMLASLASAPAGALDDDPLTSPSFRPTPDSRSYRGARTSPPANGTSTNGGPAAAAGYGNGAHHAPSRNDRDYGNGGYPNGGPAGHAPGSGGYHLPDHADPGYAYIPAPSADASQQASWHTTPTHRPAQGNPYGSYVEPAPAASYPSIPPAEYQDQHAAAGYPTYPSDHGGYQEPAYEPAAAANRADGQSSGTGQFPYHAGYPQTDPYPSAGYAEDGAGYRGEHPGQAAYADSYDAATYAPGYPADGYGTDPYAHDEYGGYPASQG